MQEIRAKTILGAGWSTLDGLMGQGLAFLVFLLMARLLTPEDFGLVAVANLYVMLAQFLIFIGFGQALVQFTDLDDEFLDTAFWIQSCAGIVFCGVTLLAPAVVAGFFGNQKLGPIIAALSPIFLFSGISSVQTSVLARSMDFRALALRSLVGFAVGGTVGIVSALYGVGVWSLVWQQLAGGLTQVIVLWTLSSWRPRLNFSRAKARRLLGFGSHAMAAELTTFFSRRSDQYFVGRFLGPVSSGYYAIAARVSNLVTEVAIRPLSRVTMSSFSRLQDEPARFAAAFWRVVEMQSLLILPATAGLALLAPEIVVCLFGEKWLPAVPAMQVLLIGGIFEALATVHQSVLASRGHPAWANLVTSVHLAVNVIAFAIAARWGMVGVACASVVRAVLIYPAELFVLYRLFGLSPWAEIRRILPLLVATGGMAAGVWGIKRVEMPGTPSALVLLLNIAMGGILFAGFLFLFRRPLFAEVCDFFRVFQSSETKRELPSQG